jgi:hypothetical protein
MLMNDHSDYQVIMNEAHRINRAYDIIVSGGRNLEDLDDYAPRSHGVGDARNTATRTYSVQPPADDVVPHLDTNVATVASVLTNPGYAHGHRYQPRHTFAPHNQRRAKELILRLDMKRGQCLVDRRRAERIKQAKKILGIAGVRIPRV